MGKRVNKRKNRIDSILPRSGLNPVTSIIPDKGPNAWNSFNAMGPSGDASIGACIEKLNTLEEENKEDRTDILLYIEWLNPYTEKKERESVFLPVDIYNKVLPEYLKQFGISIVNVDEFQNLFDDIELEIKSLEDSSSFTDKCKEEYYKSKYFEEDKKEFIDDYEYLHDLGKYEEEDEYAE